MADNVQLPFFILVKKIVALSFGEIPLLFGGLLTTLAKNASDIAENFLLGYIIDCLTKEGYFE
jgi:hypothetical protein